MNWKPGDLNVIIGPNGAGKSNLLRSLEMIYFSAQGKLENYIKKSGGMGSVVWDGSVDEISFRLKGSPLELDRYPKKNPLTYELGLERLGTTSAYRVRNELLGNFHLVEMGTRSEPFKLLQRRLLRAQIFDLDENALVAPEESISEEETLLSFSKGPLTYISNWQIPAFQKEIESWRIYQSINVGEEAEIRKAVRSKKELRVDSDGQNLISVLHTLYSEERTFKEEINLAMASAFGEDFEELVFAPDADNQIQLRIRWKSLKHAQPASNLSDGIIRFLFLLAILANPKPGTLICIDEPANGLHPSMLPIIVEYVIEASKQTQIIITTHSPDLLNAFRETRPTTTIAHMINGETKLKILNESSLDYWLKEYSLGSLMSSQELEDF